MTVLEVMADLRIEERRATLSAVTPPQASEEGIRLALQLRDVAPKGGGRVVLFAPASRQADALPAVSDSACGVLDLHYGPVLIIDLRDQAAPAGWIDSLAADDELRMVNGGEAATTTAVLSRPLAGRRNRLQYLSSAEFASSVDDVRARYPYVLCIGNHAAGSVATMMMAALADAVVLSVLPGQTTKADMHEATAELRRARANVLGFVVDPRVTGRKGDK